MIATVCRLLTWSTMMAAMALFGVVGCSSDGKQTAYPVEFEVSVEGRPAVGASVVLNSASAKPDEVKSVGTVDPDGIVRISTFGHHDGAPAGDYKVTVIWFEKESSPEQVVILKGDKLKGKYSKADNPAVPRITVEKKTNKLPALKL